MPDKTVVLAFFDSEASADSAVVALKDSGLVPGDAIGVLVLDGDGQLKLDKVGARSTGEGAGIGAVLFLLGPAGVGIGVLGGSILGFLHRKGLGLDENDRYRIAPELWSGRAGVGVLAPAVDAAAVSAELADLGGRPEIHATSDEALHHARVAALSSWPASLPQGQAGRGHTEPDGGPGAGLSSSYKGLAGMTERTRDSDAGETAKRYSDRLDRVRRVHHDDRRGVLDARGSGWDHRSPCVPGTDALSHQGARTWGWWHLIAAAISLSSGH